MIETKDEGGRMNRKSFGKALSYGLRRKSHTSVQRSYQTNSAGIRPLPFRPT
jgi:hypothetical protein